MKKLSSLFLVIIFLFVLSPNKITRSTTIDINWKLPISNYGYRRPVIDKKNIIYFLTEHGLFYAVNSDGLLLYTLSIEKMKIYSCVYSHLYLSDDGIVYFTVTTLEDSNKKGESKYFQCYCYGSV